MFRITLLWALGEKFVIVKLEYYRMYISLLGNLFYAVFSHLACQSENGKIHSCAYQITLMNK